MKNKTIKRGKELQQLLKTQPEFLERENRYLVEPLDFEDDHQITEEMFGRLILCPRCIKPLSQYWKKSKRKLKTRDDAQERYRCLRCGHCFTLYTLSFRMQHSEKIIKKFIKLIGNGLTPYKIVSHNKLNISMPTSFRWYKKFI